MVLLAAVDGSRLWVQAGPVLALGMHKSIGIYDGVSELKSILSPQHNTCTRGMFVFLQLRHMRLVDQVNSLEDARLFKVIEVSKVTT